MRTALPVLLFALLAASVHGISRATDDDSNRCPAPRKPYRASISAPHWNGWGATVEQQRYQPSREARLPLKQVPNLKLAWAFGFPGVTKAAGQPAIVDGRLFVGSTGNRVYSLDARTGCLYWSFTTEAPVRTAMTVGRVGGRAAVFFGDQRANAYSLDAATGGLMWKQHVETYISALITGSPTLVRDVLYVPVASIEDAYALIPKYECCKFRGSVTALDALTGRVIWKSYTVTGEPAPTSKTAQGVQLWGPSGAGVWSSPTIDLKRQRIYVTTGNSHSDPAAATSDAFVAFDLKTGRFLWSKQMTANDAYTLACDLPESGRASCPEANGPDFDFSSSAMLVDLRSGHRALIAGQKSGMLHAIDPDHEGKILWQARVGRGGRLGGIQWGSATDGRLAYVALSDATVSQATAATPGAQAALGTFLKLDPQIGGGLSAFDTVSGKLLWHTPHPDCGEKVGCSPGQSAAVTAIPGVVFSGSQDGHLRAYAGSDGRILWDEDTVHDYNTVNSVPAHGGSLDGPGAVIVDGMVFVNSGYAHAGTSPGNVLLAFSVNR